MVVEGIMLTCSVMVTSRHCQYGWDQCYMIPKKLSRNRYASAVWKRISSNKLLFLAYSRVLVGNGSKTQFWHAKWLSDGLLKSMYLDLFLNCIVKNLLINHVTIWQGENITWNLTRSSKKISFEVERQSLQLMPRLYDLCLSPCRVDKAIWELEPSGVFTVKSLYNILWMDRFTPTNNFSIKVWSCKAPLKVRACLVGIKSSPWIIFGLGGFNCGCLHPL
ncbi:hypothetical protein AMTRI_Chr13g122260 [Amborella trichopoda]